MTTSPTSTTAIAVSDRAARPASPKVKLRRNRIAIQHPDPQTGEALLAEAVGVADREGLHGLLGQMAMAGLIAGQLDQGNLAFMVSMVKDTAPKGSVEAMLAAQMASVHLATMRSASRLSVTKDVPQQESLARTLTRLSRTYAAQAETLSRLRSNGACAITVQNLSVQDGGKAVVGNLTQHANLIAAAPGLADNDGAGDPAGAGQFA